MGVDYYTQDKYCFVYTSADGKEATFYEEAGGIQGYHIWGDEYDSDMMTLDDYLEELSKQKNQRNTTLYVDGKWTCIAECQKRLQKILDKHPDKKAVKIYKCVFVWQRY
jgi:hypothetical protein